MHKYQKKVLLISSADPTCGPGTIALRMYNILKGKTQEVDFLTLKEVPEYPEIRFIYTVKGTIALIKRILRRIKNRLKRNLVKQPLSGYYFFYRKENHPPVRSTRILKVVKSDYDLVIVFFWQELLSFKSIKDLYDKLNCKFVFICADYSPMSGGCHFTNNCQRYKTGCGCCPAFKSKNPSDFTNWNVNYRKKVYDLVKPTILANTYMIDNFFKESLLLKDQKTFVSPDILDLEFFKQRDREEILKKYNIPLNKTIILGVACQSLIDERKGISYLIGALNTVYASMSDIERNQTLVLTIGRNGDQFASKIELDCQNLGYVEMSELPSFYSVLTMFLNTSVNDAGPSTLSQSLACGTPLVSFDMGAALDVLKGRDTGYCARLKDTQDFAKGILKISRMNDEEYISLRKECRKFSEIYNSKDRFVETILEV